MKLEEDKGASRAFFLHQNKGWKRSRPLPNPCD